MINNNKVFSGEGKMHVGENDVGFLAYDDNLWVFKVVKKCEVEAYIDSANKISTDRQYIIRGFVNYLDEKDFDEVASCGFANMLPYIFNQLVPFEELQSGGIFIGRFKRKNGMIEFGVKDHLENGELLNQCGNDPDLLLLYRQNSPFYIRIY